jgi:hypothetical protein
MQFAFRSWGREAPAGAVACDGLVPGARLDLSHWSGNKTPAHLKRDTSVEIALAFARERTSYDVEVATNNHFDTDGVLAIWILLRPELALAHEGLLVAAAEAGDFEEWPSDERGLWLDSAIASLSAGASDPISYDRVLSALDDLLPSIEKREDLWGGAYRSLLSAGDDLARGAVRVERAGRIAVVTHDRGVKELPYPWIARALPKDVDRVLLAFEQERGFVYRYEMRRWSWADTVVRPKPAKTKRGPIRRELGSEWIIKGRRGMSGLAYTAKPVVGHPFEIAERLAGLPD